MLDDKDEFSSAPRSYAQYLLLEAQTLIEALKMRDPALLSHRSWHANIKDFMIKYHTALDQAIAIQLGKIEVENDT